ncbi:hypothetical protein [uncultured Campylobacter sp.]|uniref:hypothetical protein n=1 Tax=uncultured Campylobacter sp. TaxID=218934 RepID=UPI00262103B0|nr:hypothetical protein [uncultured Campylobacter sp.]
MNKKTFLTILSVIIEDGDYISLWEIVWELNSINIANSLKVAKKILLSLYEQGYIRLFSSNWGYDTETKEICDKSEILNILRDDKNYEPVGVNSKYFCVTETERGRACYAKQDQNSKNSLNGIK